MTEKNEKRVIRMIFHRRKEHGPHSEKRRPRMPMGALILMIIGFMTVLYFAVVYGLMPLLAFMTPAV